MRAELKTLPTTLAERVARHLVMAGRLVDEDPNAALAHAREARRLAPRVAAVREAAGLGAYMAGEFAEALADLRAVRRMTGTPEHLPIIADCERGLGRPDRALTLARSDEAMRLTVESRIELLIVESGARRDMGQVDAALLSLQVPQLRRSRSESWWPRLAYAYADTLVAAGREDEAREWFARVADADVDQQTDAADRLSALEGASFVDEGQPSD